MSGNPVSQGEFHSFRIEMRDYMKQQTQLMRQMVELQTKHSNLESQFIRLERTVDDVESRLRPLEQSQSGTNEKTKYNRDLIWLLLGVVCSAFAYFVRK
ncbi:chromosome partitioning protein ParA [Vibrio vulnificus]|uniref:chromosome partitioning protein ParA n=1 Tax=Vibrio vulnificus TaxID=672 RepID=UPI001CDD38A3|nr:chromosome partitioning protein ParA [Vibrio vulnificus]MCA3987824.1 chromosome partitioning protein ParA [Vibrio vulnificus]